ncbi:hypothetical protein ACUYOF_07765 [Photobacterium ganghwense]|uniref:hypothetical protein n=1 Tax=Photobacterium ganghwense TaxID=320778 RepID=UPI004057366B
MKIKHSIVLISFFSTNAISDISDSRVKSINHLHEAAISDPSFEPAINAFIQTLPKDNRGNYFIEGDILLSKDGIIEYFKSIKTERLINSLNNANNDILNNSQFKPLLKIGSSHGNIIILKQSERNLKYWVDSSSFSNERYENIALSSFSQAATDWIDVCKECGISFTRVNNKTESDFIIRYVDNVDDALARSFFPNWLPEYKIVEVYPKFFSTTISKTGIMRHEIGHIFGYRHEHIEGIAGCDLEDNSWLPLTKYDPKSVMHYFCAGNRGNYQVQLTSLDKKAHRCIYKYGDYSTCAELNINDN